MDHRSTADYHYPAHLKAINVTFLITGSITGVLGNCLLVVLILKVSQLRSPLNSMVLYIGVLDLVHVSVKGFLYTKKILNGNTGLSSEECTVLISVLFFANFGVSTQVTAIALYRVLKVTASSLLHDTKFVIGAVLISTSVAIAGITVVFFYPDSSLTSCLSSADVLFRNQARSNDYVYRYVYTPVYIVLVTAVISSYIRIVAFTRRHQRKQVRFKRRRQVKIDVATNISLLLISFNILLAYLPFIILGSVSFSDTAAHPEDFYWVLNLRTFCVTLNMYSSVLNPFVYFYGNRYWRKIVWKELGQLVSVFCCRVSKGKTGCQIEKIHRTEIELHHTEARIKVVDRATVEQSSIDPAASTLDQPTEKTNDKSTSPLFDHDHNNSS